MQLEDEDASKYLINYINDDSDDLNDAPHPEQSNHVVHDDNTDIDVSSLPNSLIITPVPPELFVNQQLKVMDFPLPLIFHGIS